MAEIKIVPQTQSSTPSFGPSHDIYNGLTTLANNQNEIETRVKKVESICDKTEILTMAYRDLHTKRLIFLISTTVGFLVLTLICMFLTGIPWGSYDWILKLALGTTTIGLIIESIWFPNKIKEIDKSLTEVKKSVDLMRIEIDTLKSKIESRVPTQQAATANASKKSRKSKT